MKNISVLFLVIFFAGISCKKEDEVKSTNSNLVTQNKPIADFNIVKSFNSDSTVTLNFINKSSFGSTYTWKFENEVLSNVFEPNLKIINNNSYTIQLKVSNDFGSDSISKSITITNIRKLVIADFKVYLNIDSVKIVRLINKSKKFKKLLWKFSDNTTSTELNPIHEFTNNTERTIKLIVENEYNQKDSLTISYPSSQYQPYYNLVSIYLVDLNNLVYSAYRSLIYGSPGKFYYSIGTNFNSNPNPYNEYFYVPTNSLNVHDFVTYFEKDKITTYLRQKTLDLTNLNSVLTYATGNFNFFDRNATSSNSGTIYFNDTTLNVINNNGMLKLNDTELGHSFQGYLSSISADNVYTFSYPTIYSGSSNFESQNIQISVNSNSINANHSWSAGIVSNRYSIQYIGNK